MAGDRNLHKLLNTIVNSFVELCACDGGSIFTLRKGLDGKDVLVFENMVTRSIKIEEVPEHLVNLRFTLDEDTLVSRTAKTRLPQRANFNPAAGAEARVDHVLNYATYNMMSAPLITPRGDLVGVVQLVNKLPYPSRPSAGTTPDFDQRDERMFNIVAAQAALAIENSLLLEEQERLLDGFVNACVTAIEERDPVTSGHSTRVSDYTVALGDAISRTETGPLKGVYFTPTQLREIRYAAMLHDIGKISVKEDVLNKEKKLHGWQLEVIRMRLKLMRSNLKLRQQATKEDLTEISRKLDNAWKMITDANEPNVLPAAVNSALQDLSSIEVEIEDGEVLTALTKEEGFKLSIQKGSLTTDERLEIERHVTNTFQILKMVPWSRGLELVPEIAYRHHEKLDGTGYPCKCPAADIPVQSRLLTITDIYDALTADDRPYKRAMPTERALDILGMEVKHGKLDSDCFKVFVEARIFEVCQKHKKAHLKAA